MKSNIAKPKHQSETECELETVTLLAIQTPGHPS